MHTKKPLLADISLIYFKYFITNNKHKRTKNPHIVCIPRTTRNTRAQPTALFKSLFFLYKTNIYFHNATTRQNTQTHIKICSFFSHHFLLLFVILYAREFSFFFVRMSHHHPHPRAHVTLVEIFPIYINKYMFFSPPPPPRERERIYATQRACGG